MLLSHAQIKALMSFSGEDGVDVERQPFDEFLLVRRYGATEPVHIFRDGRIVLPTSRSSNHS